MEKINLNVNGMACEHCVKAIKGAVGELDGVEQVDVSLEDKLVTVEYDASKVTIDKIKEIIEEEGYDLM